MTALETILRLFHDEDFLEDPWEAREQTPRLSAALRALTVAEAGEFAEKHLQWRNRLTDEDEQRHADYLLAQVGASVPGGLVPLHAELIERQIFDPPWLYLGATEETVAQVLSLFKEPPPSLDRLLYQLYSCLIWMDQPDVPDRVHAWQQHLPSWYKPGKNDLSALEAGWEVTPDGQRRLLYVPQSYELIPREARLESSALSPVAVVTTLPRATEAGERCRWCQRPLLTLLDFDLSDPRCARIVAASGTRLRIATCEWCACFATIFTDVDFDGASHWGEANGGEIPEPVRQTPGDRNYEYWPRAALALGDERRTPFETLGRFMVDESGLSQVGGHPEWIQTPGYPRCPMCARLMVCIGQVSLPELESAVQGIIYAFLCEQDRIAATRYQET